MKERSVIHNTFVIERSYPATPQRVFAAFSDPARKRRWFGEGESSTMEEFKMDFRVGGTEQVRFRTKEGMVFTNDTVYCDIVPDQRIVIAYNMSAGDWRISSSLGTTELLATATGTQLVFTEQSAFYEGADGPEQAIPAPQLQWLPRREAGASRAQLQEPAVDQGETEASPGGVEAGDDPLRAVGQTGREDPCSELEPTSHGERVRHLGVGADLGLLHAPRHLLGRHRLHDLLLEARPERVRVAVDQPYKICGERRGAGADHHRHGGAGPDRPLRRIAEQKSAFCRGHGPSMPAILRRCG